MIRCWARPSQKGRETGVGSGTGYSAVTLVPPVKQGDLLAHDPAVAGDEPDVAVGHLRVAGPAHDLTGAVDDMVHAPGHPGLTEGQLSAGGIEGKVAAVREIAVADPGHAFAF